MNLREEIIQMISDNNRLKALLAAEYSKTTQTIDNWLEKNSPMLTTAAALAIIAKELKLSEEEILQEEVRA